MEQLKARKSLDAYNQSTSGWVKNVSSKVIKDKVLIIAKAEFHFFHNAFLYASPTHWNCFLVCRVLHKSVVPVGSITFQCGVCMGYNCMSIIHDRY